MCSFTTVIFSRLPYTHTTLSSPTYMVTSIINIQVKTSYGLKHDYNGHINHQAYEKSAIIYHFPPAPALAADGHTGALLLQQVDVGAPLSVRPVSLGPL